jgi:hypothetical protein
VRLLTQCTLIIVAKLVHNETILVSYYCPHLEPNEIREREVDCLQVARDRHRGATNCVRERETSIGIAGTCVPVHTTTHELLSEWLHTLENLLCAKFQVALAHVRTADGHCIFAHTPM